MGAAQGDGDLPEVTGAPGPGMLEEESVCAEVQPRGETLDADVLPAQAQHGGNSRAGAEEGEVTQPREAEPQPQGESARGAAVGVGSVGAEVPLPLADMQEGRAGTDVQPLEAQSSDVNVQLHAEVEAVLQPLSEATSPGTEQGGSVAPDVQPLDQVDKPELVEMEADDAQADMQLYGGLSPEAPPRGEGGAAVQLREEAENGGQGQDEHGLPHEPVFHLHGVATRQGEGAGADMQPLEEAAILDRLEDQSSDANVQLQAETDEAKLTPGGSTEAALQLLIEVASPGTEQGGSVAPDVQPLDQVDKPELVEMEAEDAQAGTQLYGGLSPEAPPRGEGGAAVQLREEAEDGGQGQGERGLPHEPVLELQGPGVGQGEGAGADVQAQGEAAILDRLEVQSSDANVQLLAEAVELKSTSGGSPEADLHPPKVGRKMSQEDEPSLREPGAMTADGARAAPKDSPGASLDPDHLYNVLFVGDSHVGKTSFLYRLHADTFNPHLTATVGLDYQIKNLVVDNKRFALRLWDSAGQERYHSITKQFFRKADGVVLMYDITSEYSFSDVRYWLSCIQEGAEDGVAILLLGNKTDCAAERQVPTKEGERLAKEYQLMFYECSAASGHNVSESIVSLIR
uniref:Ras-related protein Rab-44 n=1 Tax=Strix occidentalis caurina TaxID=311401 RepID=A0A8D0FAK7_STROC